MAALQARIATRAAFDSRCRHANPKRQCIYGLTAFSPMTQTWGGLCSAPTLVALVVQRSQDLAESPNARREATSMQNSRLRAMGPRCWNNCTLGFEGEATAYPCMSKQLPVAKASVFSQKSTCLLLAQVISASREHTRQFTPCKRHSKAGTLAPDSWG